jgi:hypothetical protein
VIAVLAETSCAGLGAAAAGADAVEHVASLAVAHDKQREALVVALRAVRLAKAAWDERKAAQAAVGRAAVATADSVGARSFLVDAALAAVDAADAATFASELISIYAPSRSVA